MIDFGKNVEFLPIKIDPAPLLAQLDEHPELWDEHSLRRTAPGTPHAEMQDIWVRYNDVKPYAALGDFRGFNDEHEAIWYPCAAKIPAAKSLALELLARVRGERLGAVLITRMPAGSTVYPHVDRGWHAEYFNCKLYTILRANEDCLNHYLDETVVMRSGECWRFNNAVMHSVENRGETERIAMITCVRVQ